MKDIKSLLLASSAFKSMNMEMTVSNVLSDNEWDPSHSCFYQDVKEDKVRELDVHGCQRWGKRKGEEEIHLNLNLLIECKSNSGWHILFSGNRRGGSILSHRFWIGESEDVRESLRSAYNKHGLKSLDIEKISKGTIAVAFPNEEAITSGLMIEPPSEENIYSAFRETNIGGEKELDSSVFWRGRSALRSSLNAFIKRDHDNCMSDLNIPLEYEKGEKRIDGFLGTYRLRANTIYIYHPILILDSHLWENKKGDLIQIKSGRFIETGPSSGWDWWFDFVNMDALEEYIRKLTLSYANSLKKLRAKKQA